MANGKISKEDIEWIGGDSRRFLERALLRAETWEEGLKYAKELRALQHPTLSAVATKEERVDVIELRWTTRRDGVESNELSDMTTHRDGIPSNELLERQQTTKKDGVPSNELSVISSSTVGEEDDSEERSDGE